MIYTERIEKIIDHVESDFIRPLVETINNENELKQFIFTVLFKLTNGVKTANFLHCHLDSL